MGEHSFLLQAGRCVRVVQLGLRLILLLLLIYGIYLLVDWFLVRTAEIHPGIQISMLVGVLLVYTLLIAIPFVPGIEIGLMMLASVAGLLFAYIAGEWIPHGRLHRMFEGLHMRRASALLEKMLLMTR